MVYSCFTNIKLPKKEGFTPCCPCGAQLLMQPPTLRSAFPWGSCARPIPGRGVAIHITMVCQTKRVSNRSNQYMYMYTIMYYVCMYVCMYVCIHTSIGCLVWFHSAVDNHPNLGQSHLGMGKNPATKYAKKIWRGSSMLNVR